MKYIRTKDGIYEVGRVFQSPGIEHAKSFNNWHIIKQADTIEELCDGLIVEENGNESNWFFMSINDFQLLSYDSRQYQWKDWTFKAFVKTDKGFAFVAEMNKNGVLELL